MKTCVSSYSFSKLFSSPQYNQLTIMKIAKDMGFNAIEFTGLEPTQNKTKIEFAEALREESEKLSLPIVNYAVSANLLNCDCFDNEIEHLKEEVDIAEILGSGLLRHDTAWGYEDSLKHCKTFYNALPVIVDGCRKITEYAKSKGISTITENHGFFCQESSRIEQIFNEVDNENFGLLVDIGNFLCADEKPEIAVSRLACFAKHVHIKDFHYKNGCNDDPGKGFFKTRAGNYLRGAIVGHGCVPIRQCISIIKDSGYNGYYSIEFEGMENPLEAIPIGLENLNNYFDK